MHIVAPQFLDGDTEHQSGWQVMAERTYPAALCLSVDNVRASLILPLAACTKQVWIKSVPYDYGDMIQSCQTLPAAPSLLTDGAVNTRNH